MMVMRRRAGETILIGDDIEIHIAEITRNRVKLAISAPRSISITPKEIKLTRDENAAAAGVQQTKLAEVIDSLRQSRLGTPPSMK